MKSETLSLKNIINKFEFLRKAVIIHSNAWKDIFFFLLTNKLIEKRLDSGNANKHYESFLRYKNRKSVKQLETKSFWQANIAGTKSVVPEHPITSHKLSRL